MLATTFGSHHEKQYHFNWMWGRDGNGETGHSRKSFEDSIPKPVLSEEFSSSGIDFGLWKHEISAGGIRGQNWEFQYFQNNRTNSYVKDGHLYIKPTVSGIHVSNSW